MKLTFAVFERLTKNMLIVCAILFLIYVVITPLIFIIIASFLSADTGRFTLTNFQSVFLNPKLYRILLNSAIFSVGSAGLAVVLGGFLAWISERTDTPLKSFLFTATIVPLIIPGILMSLAWILLLSPKIGLVNKVIMDFFALSVPPFSIYSMGGMIWVEGLRWTALTFLIFTPIFRNMDPSQEEAAYVSGLNTLQTLYYVVFKGNTPAIVGAFFLMFIRGLETFEVPALIGLPAKIPVLTSEIYHAIARYPSDYGHASVYSMLLLGITLFGAFRLNNITAEEGRFATITGKGYRPRIITLGKWRYLASLCILAFVSFGFVLPILSLAWISLMPYTQSPSIAALSNLTLENYKFLMKLSGTGRAVRNSLFLGVAAGLSIMVFTCVISWMVHKSRIKGRNLLETLTFLPMIVPGVAMGVSLILTYLYLPIPIYGTLWILLLAYFTRFLPYGMRSSSAGILQIHKELEESIATSGGTWLQTMRYVTFPLLRPALLAGMIYITILAFNEFSSSVLLYTWGTEVTSVYVFELWNNAYVSELSAMGIVMVIILSIFVYSLQYVSLKTRIQ